MPTFQSRERDSLIWKFIFFNPYSEWWFLFQSRERDSLIWKAAQPQDPEPRPQNVSIPRTGFINLKVCGACFLLALVLVSIPRTGFINLKDRDIADFWLFIFLFQSRERDSLIWKMTVEYARYPYCCLFQSRERDSLIWKLHENANFA